MDEKAAAHSLWVQVEKEVVKAIRQMEEVEVEVKKKKEVSSRVKQLRKQVKQCYHCCPLSLPIIVAVHKGVA